MEHLEAGRPGSTYFPDDCPTFSWEQAVGLLESATAQLVGGCPMKVWWGRIRSNEACGGRIRKAGGLESAFAESPALPLLAVPERAIDAGCRCAPRPSGDAHGGFRA